MRIRGWIFVLVIVLLMAIIVVSARIQPEATSASVPASFAILGDSTVTGAAIDSTLEATWASLWNHLQIEQQPRDGWKTNRVYYSQQEVEDAFFFQRWGLKWRRKMARSLDQPEQGFAAQAARELGLNANQVLMTAQDGAKIETLSDQFQRIREWNRGELPETTIVAFTANDLCSDQVLSQPLEHTLADFRAQQEEQWAASMADFRASPAGSRILIVAPLSVTELVTNQELLDQPVRLAGQITTCGHLRRGDGPRLSLWDWPLERMITRMCPAVSSTHPEDQERIARIQAIQKGFAEIWRNTVAELNKRHVNEKFSFFFWNPPTDLRFTSGDLTNDCFHLSARGHRKMAEALVKTMGLK
ncbi:MAG: SGNH/GDSL hydrolase family protein [Bdellovibrionales bacterium]